MGHITISVGNCFPAFFLSFLVLYLGIYGGGFMADARSGTKDMTTGTIWKQILFFALPLMLGNIFQMLYNTVDSIIVGNFVGTEALAAVGSTTMITNMAVFFFNGFSLGASVIIGRAFGAKDNKKLHESVETTMAATFVLCIIFTIVFYLGVDFMLKLMSTPADVFVEASVYLRIYFLGISGLLIYNMGSGILRAVGDSKRPLYFLMLTSVMNIVLDLLLVIVFKMGIAGVAIATIISQFVSAVLVLFLLFRTNEIYKVTLNDLRIDFNLFMDICRIGLPMAIQSCITAFSNIFVQGYINFFGSSVMAGWGAYNKIDQFIMLPMQSMANAATTFVSQNIGAGKIDRADKGTVHSLIMAEIITVTIATLIWVFAPRAVQLFSQDEAVIQAGARFLRTNCYFLVFNVITQVLAASLRGRGNSTAPMVIMLTGYVAIRQVYLFVVTRFFANTAQIVGFGYPVGWAAAALMMMGYYIWYQKNHKTEYIL